MIRWRYATISVRPARDNAVMLVAGETEIAEAPFGALLAQAGQDGWEMVGLSSPERGWQVFAFKQPIPETPARAETPELVAPQADAPQKPARKPENAQLPAPKRPTRGKKAPR